MWGAMCLREAGVLISGWLGSIMGAGIGVARACKGDERVGCGCKVGCENRFWGLGGIGQKSGGQESGCLEEWVRTGVA